MTKTVQLTQGKVSIVDNEDYERISQHKWYARKRANGDYYAERHLPNYGSVQQLATFILGTPLGVIVDHINGDTLDNRRCNIRKATKLQNMHNQRGHRDSSSHYKGVSWEERRNRWLARICVNYRPIFLGYYDTELDAAKAYNEAARKYHGTFARLNVLEEG